MGTKNIPASENPRDKKYKLHNVTLDQYTISVGNGLMALRFSSSKYDVQSSLKTVVNYKVTKIRVQNFINRKRTGIYF